MAATSRDELLTVTLKEYGKLEGLIAGLSAAQAAIRDNDDTSIKDVIGHRAHWIDLFLGCMRMVSPEKRSSSRRLDTNGTS